jgi:SAM-dependent methyltransferase
MLPNEAAWLGRAIRRLDPNVVFPLLNVGSSTGPFTSREQPWIDAEVFGPLRTANARVVNCDIKTGSGVDIVGDLTDPAFVKQLSNLGIKSVLCANVLEHLTKPAELARSLVDVVADGGYLIVSGPYSYPWHPDPIDTLFRPTPEELARLFPGTVTVAAERVRCGTFWEYVSRSKRKLFMTTTRLMLPYYKPKDWWASALRLGWLTREFEATCLVLQKRAI